MGRELVGRIRRVERKMYLDWRVNLLTAVSIGFRKF
jgi:hypothetical protein